MNETATHSARNTAQVIEIPLDQIAPSPYQRRTSFDKLEELAESIKVHGVLQPVTVRKISAGVPSQPGFSCPVPSPRAGDFCQWTNCLCNSQHETPKSKRDNYAKCEMPEPVDRYELIAGERRLRASRLAGVATIPVLVRDVDDAAAMQLVALENLQREDLNAIEVAESFKVLLDAGLTQTEIGARLGIAQPTVANALRLLELPEAVQERIRTGELSASHGRALLRFKDFPGAVEVLMQRAIDHGTAVKELEKTTLFDFSSELQRAGLVYSLGSYQYEEGLGHVQVNWTTICKDCDQQAPGKPSWGNPLCLRPECARQHTAEAFAVIRQQKAAQNEKLKAEHPDALPFQEAIAGLNHNDWNWLRDDTACLGEVPDCPHRKAVVQSNGEPGLVCFDAACLKARREKAEQERKAGRQQEADVIRQRLQHLVKDEDCLARATVLALSLLIGREMSETQTQAFFTALHLNPKICGRYDDTDYPVLKALQQACERDMTAVLAHLVRGIAETDLHSFVESSWQRRIDDELLWILGDLKPIDEEHECGNCGAGEACPYEDEDDIPDDCPSWKPEGWVRTCRVCGCTDADCSGCIERTGQACHWVEVDLCSACVGREAVPDEAVKGDPEASAPFPDAAPPAAAEGEDVPADGDGAAADRPADQPAAAAETVDLVDPFTTCATCAHWEQRDTASGICKKDEELTGITDSCEEHELTVEREVEEEDDQVPFEPEPASAGTLPENRTLDCVRGTPQPGSYCIYVGCQCCDRGKSGAVDHGICAAAG
jgi:ParB/RepB/Spo0J family partition protein